MKSLIAGVTALVVALLGLGVPTHAAILLHVSANDLVLNDGDAVAEWGPLTQANAGLRPTFRAAGMNGNPTVEFADHRLNGLDLPPTARSIVAVATLDPGAVSLAGLVSNSADNLNVRRDDTQATYRASGNGGNQGDFFNHGNHGGDNTYINGVGAGPLTYGESHVVLANANAPADYSNFMIGGSKLGSGGRFWLGDVSEVYIFDQTLTADEILGISSILADRWGSEEIEATPEQILAGADVLGIVIPEPASLTLLAAGGLWVLNRRRRGVRFFPESSGGD